MATRQIESSPQVREFYDAFSKDVLLSDFLVLNRRQEAIKNLCDRFIPADARILELGCGVGIVSRYLAKRGRQVVSVDISEANVAIAREYTSSPRNEFLIVDIIENTEELKVFGEFDVVLLADTLEHIPREEHMSLMQTIEGMLASQGIVIITIPSPQYQEYLKKHKREVLQVIDETITSNDVLSITTLDLRFFSYIDVWCKNQYLHFVLQDKWDYSPEPLQRSLWQRALFKLHSYWWSLQNRQVVKKITHET